ncbi:MAG TPA: hypothetical protein EYH12_02525 [Psychromonas hadalis]|nr:hypothetical protein [Psychromonas hadalis]
MSKAELSLGMRGGLFNAIENRDEFGVILKLNPKRVVIEIDGKEWDVPYSLLFPIIDSESGQQYYIEHQP